MNMLEAKRLYRNRERLTGFRRWVRVNLYGVRHELTGKLSRIVSGGDNAK